MLSNGKAIGIIALVALAALAGGYSVSSLSQQSANLLSSTVTTTQTSTSIITQPPSTVTSAQSFTSTITSPPSTITSTQSFTSTTTLPPVTITSTSTIPQSTVTLTQTTISTTTVTSTTTLKPEQPLEVKPLAHAAVMIKWGGYTVYVDPYGLDFTGYQKADLLLVTHTHPDHLSTSIIRALSKNETKIIAPNAAKTSLPQATIIQAGESKELDGLKISAVEAYNILRRNQQGQPPHPKGSGLGYIISMGGKNIFIAGDTECVPEIKGLKNIDIAFLPIDGVYTMTPDEAGQCYKDIAPKVAIPYHQGAEDPNKVKNILIAIPEIKVEIYPLP